MLLSPDDLAGMLDELGEDAEFHDGEAPAIAVRGIYRREFSEHFSDTYGFTEVAPTFECMEEAIRDLDRSGAGATLRFCFGRFAHVAMDFRESGFGPVLIILSS